MTHRRVGSAVAEANFGEHPAIPGRASLADVQGEGDGIVFPLQGVGHAHVPVGAVRSHGAVLAALAADVGGVVGVEVQQHTTGAENPEPLAVGLFWVGQRPGQIAAENHIEAAVAVVQSLGVHPPEGNVQRCSCALYLAAGKAWA